MLGSFRLRTRCVADGVLGTVPVLGERAFLQVGDAYDAASLQRAPNPITDEYILVQPKEGGLLEAVEVRGRRTPTVSLCWDEGADVRVNSLSLRGLCVVCIIRCF